MVKAKTKDQKTENKSQLTSNEVAKVVGKLIKKKRPWRNKVRKQAKKEARQLERLELAARGGSNAEQSDGTTQKAKKKRKKKKAKAVDVETNGNGEKDDKGDALKKLESGRFRFLNEQLYTMTGKDAFDLFEKEPALFSVYHNGYAEQTKKWPNHPLQYLITWLSAQKHKIVLDLGCGEAKLAEALENKHEVHSFDLVAVNDRITACDMSKLPIEDGFADVAVFCLSLMGTNLVDYIREAWRCLKIGGTLKIAEVSSRFHNVNLFCKAVCKLGFENKKKKRLTDYFSLFEFQKIEKVENKKPFGLKLKPCLYKKR